MVKVVTKALSILRYISVEPEKPKLLKDVSDGLGINTPTCARLLKALAEEGYIEQVSTRGGYILGPMSYYLSSRGVYRKEIAQAGASAVTACAHEIKEFVTLATYHKGVRYVLAHENGNPELQIRTDMDYYHDIYSTATGRLLFAFQPEKEIESYIKQNGLPGDTWKGAETAAKLKRELAKLRKDAFSIDPDRDQTVIFSYPVYEGEKVVAAFGVAMLKTRFTGANRKKVLKTAEQYAKQVSQTLSSGKIL